MKCFANSFTINAVIDFIFFCVLLLLVKVSLVMFLHYGLYVDVPLPLSLNLYRLAAIENNISISIASGGSAR